MRHIRISLSLPVVFLVHVAFLEVAPVHGTEPDKVQLREAEPREGYLIVWVLAADRRQELWHEDLSNSQAWREAIGSNQTATLRAEKNRSFLIRNAIAFEQLPVCLVLDARGREVGRTRVGRLTDDSHEAVSGRLADLLVAAEASRRQEGSASERHDDPTGLFWLGYFYWNRGERYKALRLFDEFSSLPGGKEGPDTELQARALYWQGEHATESGENRDAATLFNRALELTRDPDHAARCVLALAGSLRRLGESGEAIKSLEGHLRSRPASRIRDRLLYCLGYLYLDVGRRDDAKQAFIECTTSFPASPYSRKSAHFLQELDTPAGEESTQSTSETTP